ncbi:MAG: hypothetical protein V1721_10185 [Pseudomonadota bacterium]
MDKIVHYTACVANILLLVFAVYTFLTGYGNNRFFAAVLTIPPLLSVFALRIGPDLEERKLSRELSKARMRKELQDLGK